MTPWIPWLSSCAGIIKFWLPPSIDEQVLVLSPEGNINLAVASDAAIHKVVYADSTEISYDKNKHKLTIDCKGAVELKAKAINIDSKKINLGGKTPVAKIGDKVQVNILTGSFCWYTSR